MLSLISLKFKQNFTYKKCVFGKGKPKAVLDCYQDYFGTINIYTLYYRKNKQKALASLLKVCDKKVYMSNSEIPLKYLQMLGCKQLISNKVRGLSLSLCFIPERDTLTELCRTFSKVYVIGCEPPDYLDEIWKECGTLPTFCSFSVKTDSPFSIWKKSLSVFQSINIPIVKVKSKSRA